MVKKNNIILEKAKIQDIPEILILRDKRDLELKKYTRNIEKKGKVIHVSESDLIDLIKSKNSFFIVAKSKDKIIGFAYSRIDKSPYWSKYSKQGYLGLLYVKKSFRKKGIAKKLQDGRIKWLKSKGIKACYSITLAKNSPAINLQIKKGFKPYTIYMIKELT